MGSLLSKAPRAALLVLLLGLLLMPASVPGRAKAGPAATPSGDVNGDRRVDLGDAIYLLNWLFRGDPEPAPCVGEPSILPLLEESEEPAKILLPEIPPPPQGTRILSVEPLLLKVHAGEAFTIHVSSGGQPVPGVELTLEGRVTLTDDNGLARFIAPSTQRPHTFYIPATKAGYAHYVNDPPGIPYQTIGWYPLGVELMVFPSGPAPFQNVNFASVEFEIDQPLGIWTGATSFSDLTDKADKAGYDTEDNWWAESHEISSHLEAKNGEDIWIFFGHSNDENGDKVVDGLTGLEDRGLSGLAGGELRKYSKRRLDKHLAADGNPPGIVFLGGCKTADLLDNLINSCVEVAAGFTQTLPLSAAAGAPKAFWEALLDGKTLDEAMAAANDLLAKVEDKNSLLNPQGARLVVKTKDWLKDSGKMKLKELLEAKKPE